MQIRVGHIKCTEGSPDFAEHFRVDVSGRRLETFDIKKSEYKRILIATMYLEELQELVEVLECIPA